MTSNSAISVTGRVQPFHIDAERPIYASRRSFQGFAGLDGKCR